MATGSFLELYLTIFGWLMYENIWDILADTGLLYLPFLGLFITHVRKPMESMEGMDAASEYSGHSDHRFWFYPIT